MGLRAPANGRSITPVCFRGYCRIRRKEQRVPHFTLLCLSLPVAVWRIHGAPSPYKFRIISAAWSPDSKLPEWRNTMTPRSYVKSASVVVTFAAVILAGTLSSSRRVRATGDDDENRNDSRVQRGLEIAPVPLNLEGKNRGLVGLGSYIVNAHVPCNECHGAGPALTQFLPGQNPYFGQSA